MSEKLQEIFNQVFARVWRHRLRPKSQSYPYPFRVVKATGWRSAIIDTRYNSREHITFCFWWFK